MSEKAEHLDGQITPHRFSQGQCGPMVASERSPSP
jgi:hypothetical protein